MSHSKKPSSSRASGERAYFALDLGNICCSMAESPESG
jgi:hypothetical protein